MTAQEQFEVFKRSVTNGLSIDAAIVASVKVFRADFVREVQKFDRVKHQLDSDQARAVVANAFDIANKKWLEFSELFCKDSGYDSDDFGKIFVELLSECGPVIKNAIGWWQQGLHLKSADNC